MTQKTRSSLSSFARRAAPCIAATGLLGLSGCSPHLAGTHDVALEYVVDPEPTAGRILAAAVAAAGSKARLSAAQIAADVGATPGRRGVRVAGATPTPRPRGLARCSGGEA